jgi:nucleoside-triphosphatase THEP1
MYLSFYHLKKEPFHITPDPEFLFLSPSHKEALGSVIYGIEKRKGFVAITGEVGVGKTTILRSYLDRAELERLKIIYVFNPNVSFQGLLKTISRELGFTLRADDTYEMVNQLQEILIEMYWRNQFVVLIIDEAQNMPIDTLENLRMLSNLETSKDKLIQILLVGQPEFDSVSPSAAKSCPCPQKKVWPTFATAWLELPTSRPKSFPGRRCGGSSNTPKGSLEPSTFSVTTRWLPASAIRKRWFPPKS